MMYIRNIGVPPLFREDNVCDENDSCFVMGCLFGGFMPSPNKPKLYKSY